MTKLIIVVFGLSIVLAATSATADQCAWVSESVAKKAEKLIHIGDTVSFLCEPCGETTPETTKVASISVARVSDQSDYWEVTLNGTAVDLAYVYLKVSANKQVNVAKRVGCPADGVSPFIK